jgi:hypothetical protein
LHAKPRLAAHLYIWANEIEFLIFYQFYINNIFIQSKFVVDIAGRHSVLQSVLRTGYFMCVK